MFGFRDHPLLFTLDFLLFCLWIFPNAKYVLAINCSKLSYSDADQPAHVFLIMK